MIDPLAKYRALLNQIKKTPMSEYPNIDDNDTKSQLLSACIIAATVSNQMEYLRQALNNDLAQIEKDCIKPEEK